MAITYRPPLTPPTIDSVSIITGTLTPGTYEFMIYDRGMGGIILDSVMWQSPCVYTGAVVVASGEGVRIEITPTDANRLNTMVFLRRDGGNWLLDRSSGDSTGHNGTTSTTLDVDANFTFGFASQIEKATAYPSWCRIDEGIGQIYIDSGEYTIASVLNTLVSAGETNYYHNDGRTLHMLASINLADATSGSLDFTGWDFWNYGGIVNGANATLIAGAIPADGQRTRIAVGANMGTSRLLRLGKATLNNASLSSSTNGFLGYGTWGSAQIFATVDSKLENCDIIMAFPSIQFVQQYKYCKFHIADFLTSGINDDTNNILGLHFIQITAIRFQTNLSIRLKDCIFESGYIDYGANVTNYSGSRKVIDCLFSARTDNIPLVLFRDIATRNYDGIQFCSSFNVKVVDEDGNAIENATVKIKSNYDDITETTDSDGVIPEQIPTFCLVTYDAVEGVPTYYNIKTWYRTVDLTIEKAGYETYIGKVDIESKKFDGQFTLKKAVPILIDSKGSAHVRFNKENIGNNREFLC